MKIKNQEGFTSIDLTVSIILITLFIALIVAIMYTINANFISIERRTEATNYAINEIETLKAQNFEDLQDTPTDGTNDFVNMTEKEGEGNTTIEKTTGFSKKITIIDYSNLPENQGDDTIVSGLVKKVTVEIAYKEGEEIKTVELSTVIAKNDS